MTERFTETLSTGIVTDNVTGKEYRCEMRIDDDLLKLLNELHEENIQLREHFIYLIATALEDKECRKIYAKGLLEIFDDCSNLDEAKNKIKENLE